MNTINVELVTPEEIEFATEAKSITIPGSEGDFGVLSGHIHMISTVRPGVVVLEKNDSSVQKVFIPSGFVDVSPEHCTILADQSTDVTNMGDDEIKQLITEAEEKIASAESN